MDNVVIESFIQHCDEMMIAEELYYRVSYDGDGIYNAFKNKVNKEVWIKFLKNKENCGWLPVPPKYSDGDMSYFTAKGYTKFINSAFRDMMKYLDKRKISIEKVKHLDNIRYFDEYQVVVNNK